MQTKKITVAKVDDLKNGEFKKIEAGEKHILLSKIEDEFFATGVSCPHYGAPLDEGILSGHRIQCPWHHACFDAKTGDLQEPPARDSLPKFEVKVEGSDVIVEIPDEIPESRLPHLAKFDAQKDNRKFVIVGGGAAGNAAAQALREEGFEGQIIMISAENRIPYDRPNLSKAYLKGEAPAEWMPLRSQEFYDELGIELMQSKKVTEVNADDNTVILENGQKLSYDKILLATGGIARRLNLPGNELKNIFTLRSFEDCETIIQASQNASHIVIIGGSFIGLETASSLRHRGLEVTVVTPERVPFQNIFGPEVGDMFLNLHRENGVKFYLESAVDKFEGNGSVESIVLADGEKIKTDMVILGIGVKPATGYLKGIGYLPDGSVKVDQHFKVRENIFAAGDIATFTDHYTKEEMRIEHWRTAEQQGRIAGKNMAGKQIAYESVPFFWTEQFGLHFRYVGHAKKWDEVIMSGDVISHDFLAFYITADRVHAVAGLHRDREMNAIEELMRMGKMPSGGEIKKNSIDWLSLLNK